MEELLRTQLLKLADTYAATTGVNPPSISKLAMQDHNFLRRLRDGMGFNVKSYDRACVWFSENWPPGAEWPSDVPKPASSIPVKLRHITDGVAERAIL